MPTHNANNRYTPCKAEKIARLVLSAILPLGFYLVCYYVSVSSILWLMVATFAVAFIYSLPDIFSLSRIKNGCYGSIKGFIVTDALYSLLPSLVISFLVAIFYFLFLKSFDNVFMLTIILSFIFVAISCFFYMAYLLCNAFAKRFNK